MDNCFLGEIRIFGGMFVPEGWVACDGRLLGIVEYDALFTLLGTTYGGDGSTTFGVPNLSGRVAVGTGQVLGLQSYSAGQMGGQETVTLTASQMPSHLHQGKATLNVSGGTADQSAPAGNIFANGPLLMYPGTMDGAGTTGPNTVTGTTSPTGGNQPHENRQPSLAISYIIATTGIDPSAE